MKVSELFALPLRVVPHNSDPNWGAGIAEADDHVWVISVNPRTTGGFSPKLLVSAQKRAEAVVEALNEIDMLRAELAASEARAERLARIIRLDYGADAIEMFSAPGWGTTELGYAQASLQSGDLKEVTK